KEQLCRFDAKDGQATEQVYRYDIDLDSVWKEGLKDGLLGITFSLVNDAGEQQSNETVYLKNPMGQQPVPGVGLSPSSASGFISIYQLLGRTGSRAGKASSQKPPRSVNGIL
ncbi:MAG: hypothetical protein IJL87_00515, partial [Clostridia bacterium]|nr:hypothetical protein [Clostridia bacterium]